MNLPKIHRKLLVQELSDEVLIYDSTLNKSYCLNSTAKTVFNACNGKTTLEDLKLQSGLPDEVIFLALDEIKKNNLIEGNYVSPFTGMNRREVIRRVGLASMIALPVISSLIAPMAAQAASGCPGTGVNEPSGCPIGNVGSSTSCAGTSTAAKNTECNNLYGGAGNGCASGNATYNGSCTNTGANTSTYQCVCT